MDVPEMDGLDVAGPDVDGMGAAEIVAELGEVIVPGIGFSTGGTCRVLV